MRHGERDALAKRVNRRLAKQGEKLVLSRKKDVAQFGEARVIETVTGAHVAVRTHVTLDTVARELGINAALAAVAGA